MYAQHNTRRPSALAHEVCFNAFFIVLNEILLRFFKGRSYRRCEELNHTVHGFITKGRSLNDVTLALQKSKDGIQCM